MENHINPKDYIDGFAKGAGLTRQEASEQIASFDTLTSIEDFSYQDGIKDGTEFADYYKNA